jgi:hypothetical protein
MPGAPQRPRNEPASAHTRGPPHQFAPTPETLKSTHEDSVWDHLRGNTSAPFTAAPNTEIAVKVLDDRGNELLKIHKLGVTP